MSPSKGASCSEQSPVYRSGKSYFGDDGACWVCMRPVKSGEFGFDR